MSRVLTGDATVGQPIDRIDGPAKVTGRARYSAEWPTHNLAHACWSRAGSRAVRVAAIDTTAAMRTRGVIAVLTHEKPPGSRRRQARMSPSRC